MSDSIKLKPCPFCGAPAFMWRTNHYVYIQCSKFNALEFSGKFHMIEVAGKTENEAIEKWNTRAYSSEQ